MGERSLLPKDITYQQITEAQDAKKSDVLTGQETAILIKEIYGLVGDNVGCHLVKSNVVLACAGLKGVTDIHWVIDDPQVREGLEAVNERLQGESIRFRQLNMENGGLMLKIENAKGFANKFKRSTVIAKQLGLEEYNAATGMNGFIEWQKGFINALDRAEADGVLDSDTVDIYSQGFALGYPDQAIIDFADAYHKKTHQRELVEADILSVHPAAEKYGGAVPEFDYQASSADDPEIKDYIKTAREVLRGFYESEPFKQIEQTPSFRSAREASGKLREDTLRMKNNPQ